MTPEVYSRIYAEASALFTASNPCGLRKAEDGRVSCNRTRSDPSYDNAANQLCCSNCHHLGPNGCTVESLGCKLGACGGFDYRFHSGKAGWPIEIATKLQGLLDEAVTVGFIPWRSVRRTKEDYFKGGQ